MMCSLVDRDVMYDSKLFVTDGEPAAESLVPTSLMAQLIQAVGLKDLLANAVKSAILQLTDDDDP